MVTGREVRDVGGRAPGSDAERFGIPGALFETFNPNDKTNLAPYRFLHLGIVIILGARFIPIDAPGLKAAIWKPLIKCGQQSLEVFAVGIYLAFIGHFVLTQTSDGVVAQLLVEITGIAIMTAVAYYRSWSKRVEKSAHGHTGPPSADKPQEVSGDLARPAERAIIGVA